jgi:hypothetical protein
VFCSGIFSINLFILTKFLIRRVTDDGFILQLRNELQRTSEDLLARDERIVNFFHVAVMTFCIGMVFLLDPVRKLVYRGKSVQANTEFLTHQTTIGSIFVAIGVVQLAFTITLISVPFVPKTPDSTLRA